MASGPELSYAIKMVNEASAELKKLQGDMDTMGKSAEQAGKHAASMESPFGSVAKLAGGFVVAQGLLKLPGVLSGAGHAASDLAESQSKVNVVFGESSKGVSEFAATSAEKLGMSKQAALEALGTFGNLFQTIGMGVEPAANMSEKVVQLATDLASFNNQDPSEVLDKLRSGLNGEAEPLRSFGVLINEAAVKAKAMQMGLGDAHRELTEGEKVQARYALILDQTSKAQGDFARTADGNANQQRILAAETENLKAKMGDMLLPVMTGVASILSGQVLPALDGAVTGIAAMDTNTLALTAAVGGAVVVLPKLITGIGGVADKFLEARKNGESFMQLSMESKLGLWTAAIGGAALGLDLLLEKFAGKSLWDAFDPRGSEGKEFSDEYLQRLKDIKEVAQALGHEIDPVTAALKAFEEQTGITATFITDQVDAVKAAHDSTSLWKTDIFSITEAEKGLAGSFSSSTKFGRENIAATRELAQAMVAAHAPYQRLAEVHHRLAGEALAVFEAETNWKELSREVIKANDDAAKALDVGLRVAMQGMTGTTDTSRTALDKWADSLGKGEERLKGAAKVISDFADSLGKNNPAVLEANANIAVLTPQIEALEKREATLTATEKDRLEVLRAAKLANEGVSKSGDEMANIFEKIMQKITPLAGPLGAAKFVADLKDMGMTAPGVTGVMTNLSSVFAHLNSDDVPGAIAVLQDMKKQMGPKEWAKLVDDMGNILGPELKKAMSSARTTVTAEVVADMQGLGLSAAGGIASGIANGEPGIEQAVRDAFDKAEAAAKRKLDAHSPSRRWAHEVGLPIAQGVAMGIRDGIPIVDAAVGAMLAVGINASNGGGAGGGGNAVEATPSTSAGGGGGGGGGGQSDPRVFTNGGSTPAPAGPTITGSPDRNVVSAHYSIRALMQAGGSVSGSQFDGIVSQLYAAIEALPNGAEKDQFTSELASIVATYRFTGKVDLRQLDSLAQRIGAAAGRAATKKSGPSSNDVSNDMARAAGGDTGDYASDFGYTFIEGVGYVPGWQTGDAKSAGYWMVPGKTGPGGQQRLYGGGYQRGGGTVVNHFHGFVGDLRKLTTEMARTGRRSFSA